jgi:hypothetical protein
VALRATAHAADVLHCLDDAGHSTELFWETAPERERLVSSFTFQVSRKNNIKPNPNADQIGLKLIKNHLTAEAQRRRKN